MIFSDLFEVIMGQSPDGDKVSPNAIGIPLLNGPTEFTTNYPKPVQYTSDPKKIAKIGDLLFCVRGSTTGKMNWADREYAIGRGLAAIRSKNNLNLIHLGKAFLELQLPKLLASATGSTFSNVSRDMICGFEIGNIDVKNAASCSVLLLKIRDKIELNYQINETLEKIAQAVFKEWFIDFGPVKAKAQGKKIFGMDEETALLFTDRMEESEMGLIPSGWRVESFSNLLDSISDTYKFGNKEKIIFLNTSDILAGEFLKDSYSIVSSLPGQAKKRIKKGDILFSEIRPENKRYAYVDFESDEYVVSTKLMVLRAKNISSIFMYFLMTREEVITELQMYAESRSGTFPQITFENVKSLNIVLPCEKILSAFVELLEKIHVTRKCNITENNMLIKMRDLILPKLINGEFEVR